MKKTLIALAAVAATGAAFAQSSVTLYGRVDASLANAKVTSTTAGVTSSASTTQIANGSQYGLTGSRWGMQGTEDLGGGLKAVFRAEARFNVDTGTPHNALAFQGETRVGVTGGFGEVHLGRTYSAYDSAKAISVSKSVYDSSFFTPAAPAIGAYDVRPDNGIRFNSASYGGFSVSATVGMKETNAAGAKNHTSLAGFYNAGPLSVAAATTSNTTLDSSMVSGAYDLGVVALSAGYATTKQVSATGTKGTGYVIGAEMPMGAVALSIGYSAGETKSKVTGAKTEKFSGLGLGAKYALSKRTTVYAMYGDQSTKTPTIKTAGTRAYAVGVRHDF